MTIHLDGSFGEGGGQIIRTAMSLSALTQQSISIDNIRSKRKKSGLQPQHLAACLAVQTICNGTLEAELNSQSLMFHPGKVVAGNYEFDIGTAGSVILVAQTIIPVLLMQSQPSIVRIIGGTHVLKSPSYDYFAKVFLPAIKKFDAQVSARMIKSGYYPVGGGVIEVEIIPSVLKGVTNWQENFFEPQALINLSKLDQRIALREAQVLQQYGINQINFFEEEAFSPGNSVFIWRGYNGSYVVGEKGKLAEIVAQEAIDFFQHQNANVDSHLADQLLIYACLAKGSSHYTTSEITEHLITNKAVLEQFISRRIVLANNKISVE